MAEQVRAPELAHPGLLWFNVAAPLSLRDLAGRLVILDFWTFCCINCMHILPILRRVEEAFPREVAVIGVHSPKFAAERDPDNVARAIARYGILHPVVHDPGFLIWRSYAVRAWPTLMFVSPDGYVLGTHSGEPDPEGFFQGVSRVVDQIHETGFASPDPLPLKPLPGAAGRLSFPAKLKRLPGGEKAWVLCDPGHHQIVILGDDGGERSRVGSGAPGWRDGERGEARFLSPQGLAADGEAIYVADTSNHRIRRIDRESGRVTTLAGTGARGLPLGEAAPALDTPLASPWDIEVRGARLFFANAGTHQLGLLDLAGGAVARLAGSGAEGIEDGPAGEAALAQPSGLALDPSGGTLYFVDSETSSIRLLALGAQGEMPEVRTLAGKGLFDFGHENGPLDRALFQHPLGIAWLGGGAGRLLVADSYNGALRLVDLRRQWASDLDDGFDCADPVCLPAGEPAGAAADSPERVFMVDTNNHRILEYRLPERSYRTWCQ